MKYYLVEHAWEYMLKDEDNRMVSSWYSTIEEVFEHMDKYRNKSASALSDNRILCTFDELPTYEYILQHYPEYFI